MDPARLLLKMVGWVRRRPSRGQFAVVCAVLALAVTLVVIETLTGWPDWLTVNPIRNPTSLSPHTQ
jgi:hypothetical protein